MQIEIERVNIGDSRRGVDKTTVEKLAESMTQVGLLNPITIDYSYNLIAGAHRVEAAKKLGWKLIDCTMTDIEDLQAKLAELDENLVRNQGTVIEQGEWLAEKKRIYEELHPETKREANLKQYRNEINSFRSETQKTANDNLTATLNVSEINSLTTDKSFVTDTAEKTGLSKRTIEQSIQIAENLTPEVKAFAKEIDMNKTSALALSRKTPEEQKTIVEPIRQQLATVPPEERKTTAKTMLSDGLRSTYDKTPIRPIDADTIRKTYMSAVLKVSNLEMKPENLQIYYESVCKYTDVGLYLNTIESALKNMQGIKDYFLYPPHMGGQLS